ncbi:unnamed protein product, partial [Cladocopium goreaui]
AQISHCGVGSRLYTFTGLRSPAPLSNDIDGNWCCPADPLHSALDQETATVVYLHSLHTQTEDLAFNCRPGPKSGHTTTDRIAHMLQTKIEDQTAQSGHHTQGYGGEGCLSLSWGETEAGSITDFTAADLQCLYPVKQQDRVPPLGFGPLRCPEKTTDMRCTEKRSFRRACNRDCPLIGWLRYRPGHNYVTLMQLF